jgi:hypothetical protein
VFTLSSSGQLDCPLDRLLSDAEVCGLWKTGDDRFHVRLCGKPQPLFEDGDLYAFRKASEKGQQQIMACKLGLPKRDITTRLSVQIGLSLVMNGETLAFSREWSVGSDPVTLLSWMARQIGASSLPLSATVQSVPTPCLLIKATGPGLPFALSLQGTTEGITWESEFLQRTSLHAFLGRSQNRKSSQEPL